MTPHQHAEPFGRPGARAQRRLPTLGRDLRHHHVRRRRGRRHPHLGALRRTSALVGGRVGRRRPVAIALTVFALGWGPVDRLGEGGIERWNAYPIVLWLVLYGGYLMQPTDQAGRQIPSDSARGIHI